MVSVMVVGETTGSLVESPSVVKTTFGGSAVSVMVVVVAVVGELVGSLVVGSCGVFVVIVMVVGATVGAAVVGGFLHTHGLFDLHVPVAS